MAHPPRPLTEGRMVRPEGQVPLRPAGSGKAPAESVS